MTAVPYEPIRPLQEKEVDPNISLGQRYERMWRNNKESCFSEEAKRKFYERWGIELGLVEDIFRWDRGVTMTLLEQGLSPGILIARTGTTEAEAEVDIATISSHVKTLQEFEMAFVSSKAGLTAHFIRQLHELLLANQKTYTVVVPGQGFEDRPLPKGSFKNTPNNPFERDSPHVKIKSYCPPEDVEAEVIKLCDLFKDLHIQEMSPVVRAAWLHHRFTQIHPFPDGNGRIARTLASLVFLKAGWPPLIIRRDEDRSVYLDALEAADGGNLEPLSRLFFDRLRGEMLEGTSIN